MDLLQDISVRLTEQELFEYYAKQGYDDWMSFEDFKAECVRASNSENRKTE